MSLTFHVVGVPQPKGSARAFIPKGWKRAIVTSDNPKNKGWQQLVAEAASIAIQNHGGFRLIETAAALTVTFYLPRPKVIGAKNPPHTKKPDLDKLIRSCKDALSKIVWRDDSLVTEVIAAKHYAPVGVSPHAVIEVQELIP